MVALDKGEFVRHILLIPIAALFFSVLLAGDSGPTSSHRIKPPKPAQKEGRWKESPEARRKRLVEICDRMLYTEIPTPRSTGLPAKFGNSVKWLINNTNKLQGWSLTGPAFLKISDDLKRVRRIKIGLINGELDNSLYQELDDRNPQRWDLLTEWEQRKQRDPVFGICITFLF